MMWKKSDVCDPRHTDGGNLRKDKGNAGGVGRARKGPLPRERANPVNFAALEKSSRRFSLFKKSQKKSQRGAEVSVEWDITRPAHRRLLPRAPEEAP
jgi:hypothetical protein